MQLKENKRKIDKVVLLVILGIFGFLYLLNVLFPTQSDDIGRGIGGISAAIETYNNWNGRFGEMLLLAFGSWLSTTAWFAPLNAAAGTAVLYMLFVLVFARKPEHKDKDIAILSVLIFFLLVDREFAFGSIFYWTAGSFNYLFAWFLLFAWLLPYRLYWQSAWDAYVGVSKSVVFEHTPSSPFKDTLKIIFILFSGFLAGWSSEFAIVFIFLQIVLIVYSLLFLKKRLPLWYFAGIVSMAIGWIILYRCPGAQKRAQVILGMGGEFYTLSQLIRMPLPSLIKRIIQTYEDPSHFTYYNNYALFTGCTLIPLFSFRRSIKNGAFFTAAWVSASICLKFLPRLVFLLYIAALIFLYARIFKAQNEKLHCLFLTIAGILCVEFIFIGATIQTGIPRRASFQYFALNFTMLSVFMNYCFERFGNTRKIKLTVLWSTSALVVFAVSAVSFECFRMRLKWNAMERSIMEQKQRGIKHIVVDKDTFESKYWNYGDWGNPDEHVTEWPDTAYAKAYGVETFRAE